MNQKLLKAQIKKRLEKQYYKNGKKMVTSRNRMVTRRNYLIPNIRKWVETQFLTNHGSFNQYLNSFEIRNPASCESCGANEETAEHFLFKCPKWPRDRRLVNEEIGETITTEN